MYLIFQNEIKMLKQKPSAHVIREAVTTSEFSLWQDIFQRKLPIVGSFKQIQSAMKICVFVCMGMILEFNLVTVANELDMKEQLYSKPVLSTMSVKKLYLSNSILWIIYKQNIKYISI